MRAIAFFLTLIFFSVAVPCVNHAVAQTASEQVEKKPFDKRKLLVPQRNDDGSIVTTAFTDSPVQWMKDQQRNFYGLMRKSLQQLATGSRTAAAWSLFLISFLYGIFHAAGPGHGKAVVTSWILATENDLKRGFVIAFMSAMIQALTAIIAVSLILLLFQGGAAMARNAAGYLESASYAMIAAMGLYLIWTVFRPAHKDHEHKEHAHHDHNHRHDHDHHHVHDATCAHGHAHAPAPAATRGDWSLAKAFTLAFAVGIRPCTGAILVLVFSYSIGLYWAGIASTLAMGLGVFLTISAIAAASVYAKSFALKLAGHDNQRMAFFVNMLRLAGGIVIAALGLLLFLGSLGDQSTFL